MIQTETIEEVLKGPVGILFLSLRELEEERDGILSSIERLKNQIKNGKENLAFYEKALVEHDANVAEVKSAITQLQQP